MSRLRPHCSQSPTRAIGHRRKLCPEDAKPGANVVAMKAPSCRAAVLVGVLVGMAGCKSKSKDAEGNESAGTIAPAGAGPLALLNGFEGEFDLALKNMGKNRGGG